MQFAACLNQSVVKPFSENYEIGAYKFPSVSHVVAILLFSLLNCPNERLKIKEISEAHSLDFLLNFNATGTCNICRNVLLVLSKLRPNLFPRSSPSSARKLKWTRHFNFNP
jgi:hypothetical protein